MLGRFSMHYPSFRNSVLFWVMIFLLLSFLIFFRRFFILVVTSSCFWTRGNEMVWLICSKVFFIIFLHDWNPHTEMASVICDINLLVTRKLVFQKIMWCYFGCFFFQRDIIWCGLSIRRHLCFALRSTQKNFRILFNVVYWIGLLYTCTLFW